VYICGGYSHEAECYLNGKQKVSSIFVYSNQIGKKHTTLIIQDGKGWTRGPDLLQQRRGLTLNRKMWLIIEYIYIFET
jgi:hypothetical protein